MKRFLLGVFSIFAIMLCLVACGKAEITLQNLSIEGQKVEFFVGDTFDKGNLKVTATYSDDTTKDVTADAKVEQNANMGVAGTYAVLVSYENITKAYEISVADNKEISAISADTNNAKLAYVVGEKIDYTNVKVIEVYKNAASEETINYGDLSKYTVKVVDANGNEVNDAFADAGTYTVNISKDELKASYNVTVNYKNYETIEEAVEAAKNNADKVVSGKLVYNEDNAYVSEYSFLFGKDFLKSSNEYSDIYYQVLENGDVFGIADYDGELSAAYNVEEENINGFEISSFLYFFNNIYGCESLLSELYGYKASEEVYCTNYKEAIEACQYCGNVHSYNFSLETILYDSFYTFIDVNFSINPLYGSLENMTVTLKGYYLTDMNYNEETKEYTLKEEVSEYAMNNVLTITQVLGERTEENPYKAENYLYTAFDLTDADGNVISDEIKADLRVAVDLKLANQTPETANSAVDEIKVSVTELDGSETWLVYGSYDPFDNIITIVPYATGEYNVTIKTAMVEKVYVLKVGYAELTSLSAGIYDEYNEIYEASTATVPAKAPLSFAAIANAGADASFTATCESEDVAISVEDGMGTFVASKTGTYVIVLTSTVNAEITATLNVTVEEGVDMAELLNGEYQYRGYGINLTYIFTPESEGAVKGTLQVIDENETGEFTYEWDEEQAYLSVNPKEGSESFEYSVIFKASTQSLWCLIDNYYDDGELVRKSEVVEGLNDAYFSSDVDPVYEYQRSFTLEFSADGTGTYSFYYIYSGTFNWELDSDNVIHFTNVVDPWNVDLELEYNYTFTGTYNASDDSISFTYNLVINDPESPVNESNELVFSK